MERLDKFIDALLHCDTVKITLTGCGESEFTTKEIYESIEQLHRDYKEQIRYDERLAKIATSRQNIIKKRNEYIDKLRKENEELKTRLEKSVELPCKVKDTVYWISPFQSGIQSGYVDGILISKFGFDLRIMSHGGTGVRREWEKVFSSYEAAETALKEDENEIHSNKGLV